MVSSAARGCGDVGGAVLCTGNSQALCHGLVMGSSCFPQPRPCTGAGEIRDLSMPVARSALWDNASWTPVTQRSSPKAGSGAHPVQETPGRAEPEPSSSPVPDPLGHPSTPSRVGERRVPGCACQHRGPPGSPPKHQGLGPFRGLPVAVRWGSGRVWSSPFLSIRCQSC